MVRVSGVAVSGVGLDPFSSARSKGKAAGVVSCPVAVATSAPNTMLTQRRPIIVDIEASGFGTGSYPIEVGVVQ